MELCCKWRSLEKFNFNKIWIFLQIDLWTLQDWLKWSGYLFLPVGSLEHLCQWDLFMCCPLFFWLSISVWTKHHNKTNYLQYNTILTIYNFIQLKSQMTKQLTQQLGDFSLQTWVFISTKQFFRSPATSLRSGYSIMYTTDCILLTFQRLLMAKQTSFLHYKTKKMESQFSRFVFLSHSVRQSVCHLAKSNP